MDPRTDYQENKGRAFNMAKTAGTWAEANRPEQAAAYAAAAQVHATLALAAAELIAAEKRSE